VNKRPRNAVVIRQWRLVEVIRRRALQLEEIAIELGVGTRTVRRDLAAMEEAHLPIVKDEELRYSWMPDAGCPACGRKAA
jgi:predicted DNA-binding transcriptional regulator YafY